MNTNKFLTVLSIAMLSCFTGSKLFAMDGKEKLITELVNGMQNGDIMSTLQLRQICSHDRNACTYAIEHFGDLECLPLTELIENPQNATKEVVEMLLNLSRHCADDEAEEALIKLAESGNKHALDIVISVAKTGNSQTIELLCKIAQNGHIYAQNAIMDIARSEDYFAIEGLVNFVKNDNQEILQSNSENKK